ncbi:LysR family transcriptional regulator [Paraburkholderia caffeinilytica]|uniref:LysR family transcriptional regulator n=1 Tax=Paraburkholderia caffeinilytica TaxID=1761016 RepID=UPI0038BB8625
MAYLLDTTTARLFVAVIEEGSIAGAARRENIVPSAVSKRISELEQRLGHRLLIRHAGGVEMTSTGAIVLRRARNLIHEAGQLDAELAQLSAGVEGHVRIIASETTLVGYLPEILGQFLQAHPAVHVDLEERASADVAPTIEQHGADLGIYAGDTPPGGLWVRPCFRDQIIAVMRKEHALAALPGVTLIQLLDHEIIGDDERGALSSLLNRQAAAYGRTMRIRVRARGFDLACRLAHQGLGIGIVAESNSLLLLSEAMDLVTRPVLEPWARREHRVCVRQPDELSTAARLMLAHILGKQDRNAEAPF